MRPNCCFGSFLDSDIVSLIYEFLAFEVVDGLAGDISRLDFIVSEPTNLVLNASGSSEGRPWMDSGEFISLLPILLSL